MLKFKPIRIDTLAPLVVVLGLMVSAPWGLAEQAPRALAKDGRIRQVNYDANNVVPIQGTPLINTQVIFGDDETIVNVQNGDASAWQMTVDKNLPNVLNLKPTLLGSHTNLEVITLDSNQTRRYYRFVLDSPKRVKTKRLPTFAVRFSYPKRAHLQRQLQHQFQRLAKHSILDAPKNPAHYNWDYSFHGSRRIMPAHVFDDGRFTYLQLRPNQPVPAVFAVNNANGDESVVNYRRKGNYLVIQTTAPQLTLRNGQSQVASLFNDRLIARIQQGGES